MNGNLQIKSYQDTKSVTYTALQARQKANKNN